MKTLQDHVIFYDKECPACDLYTKAFVKSGMLDEQGRTPFTEMTHEQARQIECARAQDEIAMLNTKTGTVTYGIDSLFKIIVASFPVLRPLFACRPFYHAMRYLYAFISFNRKVIIPGKTFEKNNTCKPSYHRGYRLAYIIFAWMATSLLVWLYGDHMTYWLAPSNMTREFLMCGGQVVFQGIVISLIDREKILYYLGNMMTVSLAGALLLTPVTILAHLGLITNPYFFLGWFGLVVSLMFIEHLRRTKILELPWTLTGSWTLYRFLLLIVIL